MAKKKETKAIVYDPCDSCEVKKLNALLQSFIMNKADIFGIQFNDKMFHFDKMVKFTHDSEIEKLEQQIKELLARLAEKDEEIAKLKDKHIRNLLKIIEKMNTLQYNEELDICDFVYYLTDYIYEIRKGESK